MSAHVISFIKATRPAETGRGFKSFKSSRVIPYTRRCCRDALIQAALDPEVTRLFPYDAPAGTPPDTFFTFGVQIADRSCLLALCDETTGATFSPPDGFTLGFCLNRETILAEPILTTSRTVWSKREVLVPPLFSIRLLKRLASDPGGVALGTLEDDLVDEPIRWVDYVLAMACTGLVTVDCRQPLTHATLVKITTYQSDRSSMHWLY
ncbi:hypothetical protein [Devosia ginsengisoli]|uniref:Uncharacterized protein n=1 Tax=Devosia ginsengisoli TaxID=400770 RepID=A0A5B8LR68_9HYPH|nr:hypothetical protein [Devosia ginsengisoli]QDZ10727.1 hypothetical protein FPZ08_08155 [Devosia ginsengisoli]